MVRLVVVTCELVDVRLEDDVLVLVVVPATLVVVVVGVATIVVVVRRAGQHDRAPTRAVAASSGRSPT